MIGDRSEHHADSEAAFDFFISIAVTFLGVLAVCCLI